MKRTVLKKVGVALLSGLLVLTPFTANADQLVTGVTTSNLYVRPQPNSSALIGVIGSGNKVQGVREGNWFRFNFAGQTAYIAAEYINFNATTNQWSGGNSEIANDPNLSGSNQQTNNNVKTFTGTTNSSMFVRPAKNSTESLGVLPAGTKVVAVDEGAWLKINYGGKIAYIAKFLVTPTNGSGQTTNTNTNTNNNQSNTTTGNNFSGKTTSSIFVRPAKGSNQSLGILSQGADVQGVVDGAWIRINYKGQTGYVGKAFVNGTTTAGTSTTTNTNTNNNNNNAGTSTAAGNLFKGKTNCALAVRPAKNSSESLGVLPAGTEIVAYDRGAWLEVNYGGRSAFIGKRFVTPTGTTATTSTNNQAQASQGSSKATLTSSLHVRPAKGSTESLGILPAGSVITGEKDGAWFRFNYNGQTAYIAQKFAKVAAADPGRTVAAADLPNRTPGTSEGQQGSTDDSKEGHIQGPTFQM